jgi:lipoic acid synthetase
MEILMERLPVYLKRRIVDNEETLYVRRILKEHCLNTVCDNARCPNKNECYSNKTATFLIMGNICTRNCLYCNISSNIPKPLDTHEPARIADAVKNLGLKYVVITSVTRDDLKDGGAEHFSKCIEQIRKVSDKIKIEILTPDFKTKDGTINTNALDTIIKAAPDVFNHNIETTENIFKAVRPKGDYSLSLQVLKYIKNNSNIKVKSGLMVGLGESYDDLKRTFNDLKSSGVDILTVGQYIQPSKKHYPVKKYYTPEEFEKIKALAKECGINNYQISPLARSSYNAYESWQNTP